MATSVGCRAAFIETVALVYTHVHVTENKELTKQSFIASDISAQRQH